MIRSQKLQLPDKACLSTERHISQLNLPCLTCGLVMSWEVAYDTKTATPAGGIASCLDCLGTARPHHN